jgi:hypothetical protein
MPLIYAHFRPLLCIERAFAGKAWKNVLFVSFVLPGGLRERGLSFIFCDRRTPLTGRVHACFRNIRRKLI